MSATQAKRLRIGVIGAGRIGKVHAEALSYRVPEADVRAISDVRLESATEAAATYRIPKACEDYQEILKDREIDAVAICSSTDTHAKIIIEAAQAGKQIFCEKPVDLSLSRIDEALASVKKAGVMLQIGFNRRFDPNFKAVAEQVRAGKIGTPHLVRISSRDPGPPPVSYVKVSGGLFLDMMIHDFDMARYLIGDEVEEVYATGRCLVDPEIGQAGDIDTSVVVLKYRGGATCAIDNSRKAVYGYDQRLEVFGSGGALLASNNAPTRTELWTDRSLESPKPLHFFLERYMDSYVNEMREFVSCALKGSKPSCGGTDGRQAAVLALAAGKSLKEGRPVKVSEIDSGRGGSA